MSSPNTVIKWAVRYTINGVAFNAVGGEINYTREAVIVTDSEDLGGRRRAVGEFEAEITVTGNLATDVSPHIAPLLIAEGAVIPNVSVFFRGIGNLPDVLTNVLVDRFRKIATGDGNTPATYEFHGYTPNYVKGL